MHLFFYTIFLYLYRTGIGIAALWKPKAQKWIEGRKDLIAHINNRMSGNNRPVVWMHASSLGEFEQGRPVLESIREQYPGHCIVLSFFSPSGYDVQKQYEKADHVFYLPLDTRKNAKAFIEAINPSLVLWIKYDYWYHFLTELRNRKIPVLLVSGQFRPQQPFFKWYGRMHRYMLECFHHFFVQSESSVTLLASIGFKSNVTQAGDTRFDRVIKIQQQFTPIDKVAQFTNGKTCIVAGSTWLEDEEEICHFANQHPQYRFIVAPHDISEDRLEQAENLFKNCIRYSAYKDDSSANVLLIDNIGMLSRIYGYGTIAYIGGGFGADGVHNVLEAAVYGIPVVFGPEYEKYIEAVELEEQEGAFSIESAVEAEAIFKQLLEDENLRQLHGKKAGEYVASKAGATERVLHYIQLNRLLTT